MSMLEEVSDRGLGWPLGIGLVVAAVSAGPQIMKAGRPLMKSAIKAYLALEDKAKEMMAETGERMQDLYAEAKHEYQEGEMHMQAAPMEEKAEEPKAAAEGEKPSRSRKAKSEEGEEK